MSRPSGLARLGRARMRQTSDERLVALVRRGEPAAFEAVYERHVGELLAFCVYMLGSRHDAEDAVQATFISAYKALRADLRPVTLRPWLFTIARNECISTLRARRPTVELNGEPAPGADPLGRVELQEEVREMLANLRALPERQRSALALAELHGLSQAEIATVLGVRPAQVKAYVYQARANLSSERRARDVECREIREELAIARGAALLKGRLRRHVRSCAGCRAYASGVSKQRQYLGALLPIAPSLALRYRALENACGIGSADPTTYVGGAALAGSAVAGSLAGTAAEVAGGGIKALAAKVAASVAALGATVGVGASVLSTTAATPAGSGTAVTTAASERPQAAAGASASSGAVGSATGQPDLGAGGHAGGGRRGEGSSYGSRGHSPRSTGVAPDGGLAIGRGPGASGPGAAPAPPRETRGASVPGAPRLDQPASRTRPPRSNQAPRHEPSQSSGGSHAANSGAERLLVRTEHETERAESKEQRKREHEERVRSRTHPPPKTEEERLQARKEREERREQGEGETGPGEGEESGTETPAEGG
jgi:RNA polymerase sigma factor (sigma-70 family)